ncbi:class I adenylate-forming enzyme family protein [Agromyces sp. NPDC049794]|uniref:class I adenylate-forming enzyme family protein n=1 Tax=unclassified Agromyces TaxID=2639701 RepID=UPI0033E1B018
MTSEALPLGDLLVRSATRTPDRIAVALPGEEHTYAELLEESILVARGLLALGVERGDHVGVVAPNSYEFVIGLFGAALVGAVSVPLSVRSTPRELAYVIPHAELKVILATDLIREHVDTVQRIADAVPGLAASDASQPLDLATAPHLRHVALLRGQARPGVMGRSDFVARAEHVSVDAVDVARSRVRIRDAGLVLYTSGTTSNPKGCLLAHETITRATLARPGAAFPIDDPGEPLVMWCAPPLFHSAAIQGLLYCIHLGGTFLTDLYLDGDRAVALAKKYRANSLWGMFMAAMRSFMDANNFDVADFSNVRSMMSVGSPADLMQLQEVFSNAMLVNGLGMTELTGWFCLSDPSDTAEERARTQGKPVRGAEVRIVDPETREEVPFGVPGELLIRTYTVMLGYFHDEERTRETIDEDGWLHTGDLVSRRSTGHLVFEGRIKDMLKVGGENVPTAEIETYLCEHPDVLIAEVVGVPDPRLEEAPVAFVQLTKGSTTTEADLIEFCRGNLATFKMPRAIFFKEEEGWPMSSTKINKVALRVEACELRSAKTLA